MPAASSRTSWRRAYASAPMAELWSPEHKVVLERQLWIAVLRAQRDLGLDISEAAIEDHVAVIDKVDLASIEARERVTKHDVKARIEEFSALAGHEQIHEGMTSRDLTENVEQLQVRSALELVRDRMVTALARLADRAAEHASARAHRAQPQRAPRRRPRSASASPTRARSCCRRYERVERAARPLSAARDQGPGRHAAGQLDLLGGAARGRRPRGGGGRHLGFDATLTNVGQVYPRSLDLDVVSALVQAAAGAVQPGHHHPSDGRASSWPPRGSSRARSVRRPCRTR